MSQNMEQLYREVLLLLLASPSERGCRKDIGELFHCLGQKRRQKFGISNVRQLVRCLEGCTKLFEVEINGRDDVSVVPKTSLTICRIHSNKSGSCPDRTCPDLHFCIFFLLSGECCYGNHCHFGHELGTSHNQRLLQRHLLRGLNITNLRALFGLPGVRQGVTLPQVCKYYNVNRGCSKGQDCHSLHLCLHYVMEQCKFSTRCERNHDISHAQVTKVLTQFGVKVKHRKLSDILQEVRFYHHRHEDSDEECGHRPVPDAGVRPRRSGSVPNQLRGQNLSVAPQHGATQRAPSADRRSRTNPESPYARLARVTPSKTEEICLYFLKGLCRFQEKCNRLHSPAPYTYLWRVTRAGAGTEGVGGADWWGLPSDSSHLLERAYSLPQNTVCTVTDIHGDELEVEFRSMTGRNLRTDQRYHVRRVSTPSSMDPGMRGSVSSPNSNAHLATVWAWFYKDEHDVWREFGAEKNGRGRLLASKEVESHYLMSSSTPMTINNRYVLDLRKMRLKDVDAGRKFKVRRRPLLPSQDHGAEPHDGDFRSDSESSVGRRRGEDDDDEDDDGRARRGSGSEDDDDRDDEARARSDISDNGRVHGGRAEEVSPSAVSLNNFLSPIHSRSQQFLKIKGTFTGTLGVSCKVLSILSINNPSLNARYKRVKSGLRKRRVSEEWLYYGPSPDEDITAVYTHGIDCDNPGSLVNGVFLGKGGYFHMNAAQANKNIQSEGERYMFVMKCLVGSVWGGDCKVDNADNPKTFIISNPSQVRPQYLITYRLS